MEYLRKNSLGVATFLILEKQKHLAAAAAERVEAPEGVPRLFDLIRSGGGGGKRGRQARAGMCAWGGREDQGRVGLSFASFI